MRKIKVAQIGSNRYSHSREIFRTMAGFPELFEIAGYTLVEDEETTCAHKTKGFGEYKRLTLEEILSDDSIEAVTVETDEIHLTKYALMAVKAGKHVHMEKPGSQSLEDFTELIELAKKNGTVLHIGYMYRYNPYISEALDAVRKGDLGKIYSVEAHMSRLDNETVREWLSSFRGGMMFYLGCHLIDLVYQIQGEPLKVIPLNKVTGFDGIDAEDFGCAILEYPSGISMIRVSGNEIGGFLRRQLVILGTKKCIELKPLEEHPAVKRDTKTVELLTTTKTARFIGEDGKVVEESETSEQFGRYDKMMSCFAAMVRGEIKNPYTYDYELNLFKLILKCCGM